MTLDKTRDKVNDASLALRSLDAIKLEEKENAEKKRKQKLIIEEENKKKAELDAIELKQKEKKAKEAAIVAAEVKNGIPAMSPQATYLTGFALELIMTAILVLVILLMT